MALHRGSVSFPLVCVYRGCGLSRKEEGVFQCLLPRAQAHGYLLPWFSRKLQQSLLQREEEWNRASEAPDMLLHMQSKSEVTWAQENHVGTRGCAGLSPVLKYGEQVLS